MGELQTVSLWQIGIVQDKLHLLEQRAFSLEVDLRVARKVGDVEMEKFAINETKKVEALRAALELELRQLSGGEVAHD